MTKAMKNTNPAEKALNKILEQFYVTVRKKDSLVAEVSNEQSVFLMPL